MELLQIATAQFITKCDGLLLQIATPFLLQSATRFITNCDRYYKLRWICYKLRQVLQSAMIITNCGSTASVLFSRKFQMNLKFYESENSSVFLSPSHQFESEIFRFPCFFSTKYSLTWGVKREKINFRKSLGIYQINNDHPGPPLTC